MLRTVRGTVTILNSGTAIYPSHSPPTILISPREEIGGFLDGELDKAERKEHWILTFGGPQTRQAGAT